MTDLAVGLSLELGQQGKLTHRGLIKVLADTSDTRSLMAAAWMAHCGVKTRIVDKRNAKIYSGQADGLQCRSLEIFDSLGFGDRAWKEANHMIEVR